MGTHLLATPNHINKIEKSNKHGSYGFIQFDDLKIEL